MKTRVPKWNMFSRPETNSRVGKEPLRSVNDVARHDKPDLAGKSFNCLESDLFWPENGFRRGKCFYRKLSVLPKIKDLKPLVQTVPFCR